MLEKTRISAELHWSYTGQQPKVSHLRVWSIIIHVFSQKKGWNETVGLARWLLTPVLTSHPHIVFLLLHFQALAQLQLIDYIGEQTALLIKVSLPSPSPLPRYLVRIFTIYNQTQVRPYCVSALIHLFCRLWFRRPSLHLTPLSFLRWFSACVFHAGPLQ